MTESEIAEVAKRTILALSSREKRQKRSDVTPSMRQELLKFQGKLARVQTELEIQWDSLGDTSRRLRNLKAELESLLTEQIK